MTTAVPMGRVLLAMALAAAIPAGAQTGYGTRISVDAWHGPSQAPEFTAGDYLELEALPAPPGYQRRVADSDGQMQLYNGLATAWTDVRAGGLHLQAFAQAVPSPGERSGGIASASGLFSDRFVLDVPGAAPGALFTVSAQIVMRGSGWTDPAMLGWQPNAPSSLSASMRWNASFQLSSFAGVVRGSALQECRVTNTFDSGGCITEGTPALATIDFTMANQGDATLQLVGGVRANASSWSIGGPGVAIEAFSDMSHTVAWGGVLALRDADGAPVSGDWSLSSASSSFDYRQAYAAPVPEPGTLAMAVGGLAVVAGWARRPAARRGLSPPAAA